MKIRMQHRVPHSNFQVFKNLNMLTINVSATYIIYWNLQTLGQLTLIKLCMQLGEIEIITLSCLRHP